MVLWVILSNLNVSLSAMVTMKGMGLWEKKVLYVVETEEIE